MVFEPAIFLLDFPLLFVVPSSTRNGNAILPQEEALDFNIKTKVNRSKGNGMMLVRYVQYL